MARIPTSQRQVNIGRAPVVQPPSFGASTAQAIERAGATGVQVGLTLQADQARLDERQRAETQRAQQEQWAEEERQNRIERARQEQAAEQARKARDSLLFEETRADIAAAQEEIATQLRTGALKAADAEGAWAERSRKLIEERLPQFSDDNARGLLAPALERLTARGNAGVRRAVEQRNRQDVTADMQTQLRLLQRDYAADPARAEAVAATLFDTLGPQSLLTPQQLADARLDWKAGAQFTVADAAVRAARNDPKAVARAQQVLGDMKDIDPQRRVQLEDRLSGYQFAHQQQAELRAQRAARESEARLRRAAAEFETFQALADRGTALDPAYVDRVTAATAGTPYQQGVRAVAQQARETGGLAAQPIGAQREALAQIDALIATRGSTPELVKRRDQVQKVLNGAEQDIQADPLRAAAERGVIARVQPLNLTALDALPEQLANRALQADVAGAWAGRPVSPLTSEEAQQVGRMLDTLPPDQRGQAVATIARSMRPDQAAALARQMDKQSRPLALALAADTRKTSDGRQVAELILSGAQAVKDKAIKEDTQAEVGLRTQIAAELGDAVSGQTRDDLIDAARLIFLGKQASGERVTPAGAVRLAVGGPIVELNGRRVPLPYGDVSAEWLADKLRAYPAAEMQRQAPDGYVYLPGRRPMGVPEFLAALPGAQLEAVGLGRYAVRAGGSLAVNSAGRPIVVDVTR